MDLWVVGAAAAAGYVAKYCRKFSKDRDGSSQFSPEISKDEKCENQRCLFHRLTHRTKQVEDNSNDLNNSPDRMYSAMYQQNSTSESEGVSTSGSDEKHGNLDGVENFNVLSMSSPCVKLKADKKHRENVGGIGLPDEMEYVSRNHSLGETDSFHGSARNQISLRTKYSYSQFIKPLTSQESCFMAQLYNEHAKIEEYVLGTCQSPCTTMRPLLVIDGTQIISRANVSSLHSQSEIEDQLLRKKEIVYGVPPLQKIRNMDLPKKIYKAGMGQKQGLNNSNRVGRKDFFSKRGSHDGMVLFSFGISIGLLSSLIASRREVDKLKGLLKQSENLVKDLQEELEMNDSLTVKEIANENYESQVTLGTSSDNRVEDLGISSSNNGNELLHEKTEERSELMSNIEAELEAELERLGLNMNTSNGERKLSDLVELDSDYEADFAQGELRADMVAAQTDTESKPILEESNSPATHSCNYPVSPRELSLRLHEVIQSRLEERVIELEIALENSQMKMQRSRSEPKNFQRKWLVNELRYLGNEETPVSERHRNSMSQPMVMSLSGEALAAYNEACEELTKINDSDEEEEDSSCSFYDISDRTGLPFLDQHMPWDLNGEANGSLSHSSQSKERQPKEINNGRLDDLFAEHSPRIQEILSDDVCKDETSGSDDEMERQLIMQIVEKSKKGSPAVLNAQRVLFSIDD